MCNACNNMCCGSDQFEGCGCACAHPDCAAICDFCELPEDVCECDFDDEFNGEWEE